jgi:hypothetical protein
LAAKVPFQAPEAVHELAFVELQVSVELLPLATLVGDALSVAVGAGRMVTLAIAVLLLPPGPVQTRE